MISKSMLDKFAKKLTQMQSLPNPSPQPNISPNSSNPQLHHIKPSLPQLHQIKQPISLHNNSNNQIINHQLNQQQNQFIILDDSDQQHFNLISSSNSYHSNHNQEKNYQHHLHYVKSHLQASSNGNHKQTNQSKLVENHYDKNHLIQNYKSKKINKINKKHVKKSTCKPFSIQSQCPKQNAHHQQSHQISQSKQQPPSKNAQSHQISNSNFQQLNPKNSSQQLFVYMMNNLLYLCGKIPSKLLKLYIKQLSQKHTLPYTKILIDFSIQQLIAKFYQTHDIQGYFHQKYILSQLQQLIPQLLFQIDITNWVIIRKIVIAVFNWFKINSHYTDDWLINSIKKKRKILKEYHVNYQLTLAMAKGSSSAPNDITQQPTPAQVQQIGYTTLREYLLKNRNIQLNQTQLQQTDDQKLQTNQTQVHIYQLKYYKKIKQKLSNLQKQLKIKNQTQIDHLQYVDDQNSRFIPLEIQIVKIGCKLPTTVEILSEFQQSQQQEPQKNNPYISQKQTQKYHKTKQKTPQNSKKRSKSKQQLLSTKSHPVKIAKTVKKQSSQPNQQISTISDNSQQLSHSSSSVQQQKDIINPLHYLPQRRIRKTTQHKIKQKSQQILPSSHQRQLTLKQSYKQHINYQLIKSDELLKKLDQILYQFFLKQPQFTTKTITNQIQRILKQQLRVPVDYHQQISLAWFRKYTSK